MIYSKQKDIYENLEVGMIIEYYTCSPRHSEEYKEQRRAKDIIVELRKCPDQCRKKDFKGYYCDTLIVTQNRKRSQCFMDAGETSIIAIYKQDFFEESDFIL